MANNLLLVALGGAAGSVLRYLLGRYGNVGALPYGTLAANIAGCLIIGLLWGYFTRHINEGMRLLLIAGFCGGFTTFSTFSYESVHLLQQNKWTLFIFYTALSVIGGLIATFAGYKITA